MVAIARSTTVESLYQLAARQYGLISREQALAAGVSPSSIRHAVDSKRWTRKYQGVYIVAGVPDSWHQRLLAACMLGGDEALASGRSAAALLRLSGFRPGPIEISTPRNLRRSDIVVRRVASLELADVTQVSGIPTTDPARTLIDLAGITPPEPLEIAFHDALFRLISVPRLRWRLNLKSTKGQPGVGLLREWLEELGPNGRPAESGLETILYRRLVNAGLPRPVRQHPIGVRRPDLAYPEIGLAIEAYGYGSHNGKVKWQKDLDRDNELQSQGWTVVHVTWDRLMNDPDGVVDLIRGFLGRGRLL